MCQTIGFGKVENRCLDFEMITWLYEVEVHRKIRAIDDYLSLIEKYMTIYSTSGTVLNLELWLFFFLFYLGKLRLARAT